MAEKIQRAASIAQEYLCVRIPSNDYQLVEPKNGGHEFQKRTKVKVMVLHDKFPLSAESGLQMIN